MKNGKHNGLTNIFMKRIDIGRDSSTKVLIKDIS
jgi:hypothetical protein